MKPIFTAALGAAAFVGALGAAPAPMVRERISLEQLGSVLNGSGWSASLAATSHGTRYIKAQIPNTPVMVMISGLYCTGSACEGFRAEVWNKFRADNRLLTQFNECCFARATIDQGDTETHLIGDYMVEGGVTDATLLYDMDAFVKGMVRFAKMAHGGQMVDLGKASERDTVAALGFAPTAADVALLAPSFTTDFAARGAALQAVALPRKSVPLAGAAPAAHFYDGVTMSELQAALSVGQKLKVALEKTPSGISYLAIPFAGMDGAIFAAGRSCNGEKCQGVEYFTLSKSASLNDNLALKFNGDCCYVRLVAADEGMYRLSGDFVVAGGVSERYLNAGYEAFGEGLARLVTSLPAKSAPKTSFAESIAETLDAGRLVSALRRSPIEMQSALGAAGEAYVARLATP